MTIDDQVLILEIVAVVHEDRTALVVTVILACFPVSPDIDVIAGIILNILDNLTVFCVESVRFAISVIYIGRLHKWQIDQAGIELNGPNEIRVDCFIAQPFVLKFGRHRFGCVVFDNFLNRFFWNIILVFV